MALITCGDCHQQTSDTAPACIHCGRPNRALDTGVAPRPKPAASESGRSGALRRKQPTRRSGWLGTVAGVVVILVVLLAIAFGKWSDAMQSLLQGLGILAVGFAVILSDDDRTAAPRNRRARKSWGDHFAAQDRQQEFHGSLLIGGVFIAIGIVKLGLAALDAAG
jgi:predicted lipid-binding transport protein (Tim44 family)